MNQRLDARIARLDRFGAFRVVVGSSPKNLPLRLPEPSNVALANAAVIMPKKTIARSIAQSYQTPVGQPSCVDFVSIDGAGTPDQSRSLKTPGVWSSVGKGASLGGSLCAS